MLQGYYDVRMDSRHELEVKGKVRIFKSESEVDGDYEIISYNTYKTLLFSNFLLPKKFYEKAVEKAYALGGNGVIITSAGFYTVISLSDWDSDNAESAMKVNAILNTTLMDKFNRVEFAKLEPREVKRCVADLNNEIKFNLQTMKTSEEAIVVGKKIQTLINWNLSQTKVDTKLSKTLEGYAKLHKLLYKRIVRKERKVGKVSTIEFEVNLNDDKKDDIDIQVEQNEDSTDILDEPLKNENKVVYYNGVKAFVASTTGNKVILLAADENSGTWNDAVAYCKVLGQKWRLPSASELKKISETLQNYIYWTCDEASENSAKYYSVKDNSLQVCNKARIFNYQPIAIIDHATLEILQ